MPIIQRHIRQTVIQVKPEVTYGIDPGSYVAADAVLISDATFRIVPENVPRDLIRSYFGASEELTGTRRSEIEFTVELAGSGTVDLPPQWGKLLIAAGFSETITAANRVEYAPITNGIGSATFRYHIDGVRYTARGARATAKLMLNAYERPTMRMTMWGFDTSAVEDLAVSTSYAGWQRPQVVADANSGDIRLGGTYAAGVVSAGTILPSRGLEIDIGSKLSHIKMLGGEAIDITDRAISGMMKVALASDIEPTWRTDINANTLASVGFNHGTVAGNRLCVFAPSVQRTEPQMEDYEGRVLMSVNLRVLPTTGNDDIRIVSR